MHINPYTLKEKGWSAKEIDHAAGIVEKHKKKWDQAAYWVLLIVTIVGNFLLSTALLPMMLLMNDLSFLALIGVLGIILGVLITGVIKGMDLHFHHHTAILFIVPLIAFISFFFITGTANLIALQTNIAYYHNPGIVGLVYIVAYLLPYIQFLITRHLTK
ncbi:hypothetical protein C4573_04755 [Candidatus Woesearchaeota archaeon]|nr:MAG: hypothetical protein C4573_04755 [Candidatus Woesearchaeota archaeon]